MRPRRDPKDARCDLNTRQSIQHARMSFHWNLSSDEEEEFENWFPSRPPPPPSDQPTESSPTFARLQSTINHTVEDNLASSDSDDDGIDWEDAYQEDERDDGKPKVTTTLRPVQIDLGGPKPKDKDAKPSKKRKRRNAFRHESLPDNMKALLLQLHRSHLLTLISSTTASSNLTDLELATASSLIPPFWMEPSRAPTMGQVRDLLQHHVGVSRNRGRRKARRNGRVTEDGLPFGLPTPSWRNSTRLFVAMVRSIGWRCRYVCALSPMKLDLDVDHPFLLETGNVFEQLSRSEKKRKTQQSAADESPKDDSKKTPADDPCWVEVLCRVDGRADKYRWVCVDLLQKTVDQPNQREKLDRKPIEYALAVEHYRSDANVHNKLVDVTRRYASSWTSTLRARGWLRGRTKKKNLEDIVDNNWWTQTLRLLNQRRETGKSTEDAIDVDAELGSDQAVEADERMELKAAADNEKIPTSKAGFQTHPIYVIPSVLGKAEVLAPDASKRVFGVFKGQLVYKRSDVSTAYPARKWLYQGRKVLDVEIKHPIKTAKARKKAQKGFQALHSYGVGETNDGSEVQRQREIEAASSTLENGVEHLYAKWQTEPWSPIPVGPADQIPTNKYKNIELELLNPGLVHIDENGLAKVAKQLGIPYAPCLVGFEGHGGQRTPSIRGIVVHEHNEQIVREASVAVNSHAIEKEAQDRRRTILRRWKRIMLGVLTKDEVDRKYG